MILQVSLAGGFGTAELAREFKVNKPDERENVARAVGTFIKAALAQIPFRNSSSRFTVTVYATWRDGTINDKPPVPPPQAPRKRRKAKKG